MSEVGTIPLFCQNLTLILVDSFPIFKFFRERKKNVFPALLHLMACWSISSHIYHIYIFQIAHYFWTFSLLMQPPFYICIFPPVLSAACASDLLMSLLWLEYYLFVYWFVILDRFVIFFTNLSLYSQILLIIVWTFVINYL